MRSGRQSVVILFFIFMLSSFLVVLFGAQVYQSITEDSFLGHTSRTAMAYISEKIHQNDLDSGVCLIDDDTLVLQRTQNDIVYKTYIYAYDGALRELFVRDGVDFSKKDGQAIVSLKQFSIKEVYPGLFRFSCLDDNDQREVIFVSIKTGA